MPWNKAAAEAFLLSQGHIPALGPTRDRKRSRRAAEGGICRQKLHTVKTGDERMEGASSFCGSSQSCLCPFSRLHPPGVCADPGPAAPPKAASSSSSSPGPWFTPTAPESPEISPACFLATAFRKAACRGGHIHQNRAVTSDPESGAAPSTPTLFSLSFQLFYGHKAADV